MNKKAAVLRSVFCICTAIAWWGLLYPELTMTPDTYKVVWEDDMQSDEYLPEWDSDHDIYRAILEADGGRIRYKSRLLMQLEEILKNGNDTAGKCSEKR